MDAGPRTLLRGNRDTLARAGAILEAEGLVRTAPPAAGRSSGTAVPAETATRQPSQCNLATSGPGYSFPAASGQEMWTHPSRRPSAKKITGPGMARDSQRPA